MYLSPRSLGKKNGQCSTKQEILCGDSFSILKNHIGSECVDIIITSPPYNAAHKYDCYNDDLEFTHYLDSMKAIFSECYRVLKIGGRICVNVPFAVKNKESKEVRFLSVHIMQILNTIGFKEFELITWHKGKDIRHFQGNNTAWGSWKSPSCPSFRPLGEAVLVFYKEHRIHKGDLTKSDISAEEFKAWTKNMWYFDKDKELQNIQDCNRQQRVDFKEYINNQIYALDSKDHIDIDTGQVFPNVLCVSNNAKKDLHPAPYPEELIERLLKLYSYQDDIVLDPFLGTGTTVVVAQRLKRQFIGIELSKKYCKEALQRLNENPLSIKTLNSTMLSQARHKTKDNKESKQNKTFKKSLDNNKKPISSSAYLDTHYLNTHCLDTHDTILLLKSFDTNFESLVNSSDSSGSLSEIFPYKEGFSPYLLSTLAQKYHCNRESLFDPFCGAGSSFMDYSIKQCYGFDTNPLAFHIAKAKLEKLDSKNLQKARDIVKNFHYQKNMFALQDSVPKSHIESRSIKNLRLDSVYKLPQWESFGKYANAEKYTTIMHFIESFKELDSKTYHFIKYLVIANLSAMLDYKRDGNGIKYRESKITDSVDYLKELTLRALEIKERFDSTNQKILHVRNESCIHQNFYKILESQIDCILTSPPYANLFDYFEIYKMELWASGLVKSYEEWRELKKSALRNNKNARLDSKDYIDNALLHSALKMLQDKGLESSISIMLQNYFYDMQKVMQNCFKILKNGGYFFIVVGNSSYKGIPIRTDEILAQEAQKLGFICEEILIARKLNTSSQQMKIIESKERFYLRESIIVLRKGEI